MTATFNFFHHLLTIIVFIFVFNINMEVQSAHVLDKYPQIKKYTIGDAIPANTLPVIVLERDVYRRLNDTYDNLRIFSSNRWIPFVIEELYHWQEKDCYTALSGEIIDFKVDYVHNEAVIDYQLTIDHPAEIGKLELVPRTSRKFNKHISLEFDNGQGVNNLKFFNHGGTVDFSRYSFEFAPHTTRKIRIKITPFSETHDDISTLQRQGTNENFTEKRIFTNELSLDRITFFEVQKINSKTQKICNERPIKCKKISKSSQESSWEFELDKMKVTKLTFNSSTSDYRRQYRLDIYNSQHVSFAKTHKFSGIIHPGFELNFTGLRADKAVLTIENGDNEELKNPDFHWFFIEEALLMEPGTLGNEELLLYFGSDTGTPPKFDLAGYISKFDGMPYYRLTATATESNPLYNSKEKPQWAIICQKLLPCFIGLLTVVLAFASYRILRNISIDNTNNE